MNFRRIIPLAIALTMVAALVACSSSSKPAPVISIAATTGSSQSAVVGTAFATQLQATVTTAGSPTSGASVTFTAPSSGASGTFADGGTPAATDTEMTGSNGVATATVFTANDVAGTYTITATVSGATAPANFTNMANTSGAAASMTAKTGSGQSATILTAFGAPLVANVVDGFSNPVQGVSVTFTAPSSGASGLFADGGVPALTDMETTDANGNATSTVFTANAIVGGPYNVVASATGLTSVNFALTNNAGVSGGLGAGNYVFSVVGTDSGAASCTQAACVQNYVAAGVIQIGAGGTVAGGEMSFSDYNYYVQEAITGGGVAVNPADSNLLITINTGDVNIGPGGDTGAGTGTLVFSAAMASSTDGALIEYDSWATSVGALNAQTSTAALCPTTPCGYAFNLVGVDANDTPLIGVGGVFTIDGASGGIDGTGSIFDVNDVGSLSPGLTLTTSTVGAPDTMGYLQITLNSSFFGGSPGIQLDGYLVDANHIRLVENWTVDFLSATTGGTALAQTGTGGFTTASISGATYVVGTEGADVNGVLQVAGELTFNANGTVSGNLSFNDIASQNAQGGTAITGGTWADDGSGTGRVLVTGATDGATYSYDLTLYETGDGHATVLSMDAAADTLVGVGQTQASGLGVASLTGNYTLGLDQYSSGVEFGGDGQITANASALSLTGFLDQNGSLGGAGLLPNSPLNATYTGAAGNPIIQITGSGGGGGQLTLYLIDATQGVVIENDAGQLSLGLATNQ